MNNAIERAKIYIDWMRKNSTLSLAGYFAGLENDGDANEKPSIGRVGNAIRPKIRCLKKQLDAENLPLPPSRTTRKLPDLKSENPTFAAMLVKLVNERFGGDAPKVYTAAGLSRKTYSAIASNELRPVSKDTAIQLALALRLSRTEADAFLKAAGFAFSPAILEDIIACACIEANIFDIAAINGLLADYGAKLFDLKTNV